MINKKIAATVIALSMSMAMFTACSSDNGSQTSDVVVLSSKSTDAASETSADASADSSADSSSDAKVNEGFVFEYNNIQICVNNNMKDIYDALGKEDKYQESASCAALGMAKTYVYGNGAFQIQTTPDNDRDVITSIVLINDTVQTAEGIRIGSSKDDVIKAYGESEEGTDTTLVYSKAGAKLVIVLTNDQVSQIVYNASVV